MNQPRHTRPLNPRIRSEATEWLLRFSEGEVDTAGREEFYSWLRTSPEHVRAYLRIAAFWQEAGRLDGKQGPRDIEALIERARQESNVVPLTLGSLPERDASSNDESAKTRPGHVTRALLGIAATLLLAVGVVGFHQYLTRNVYETEIGELRTINLSDGSTLILNADSKVRVRYSDSERGVDLEAGQALFKVARNPERPFVVRSGETSVRAVGTQFDVNRRPTGTTVTVVEGKVAVTAGNVAGSGTGPELLSAGEQLTIPAPAVARTMTVVPATTLQVRSVKVDEATAWTEGLLIFDGTPLAEVIAEFNRQNRKRLVLRGAADLAEIKITGAFPANGAERITRFLHERFDVTVHESDDQIVLTRE